MRGAMIEVIKEGLVRRHSPSGWPFFSSFMQREKPTAVRPAWAHLLLELHSASSCEENICPNPIDSQSRK